LEALTHSNPVLKVFEDAHWTDPTSLELFSRMVDRIRTLRVLLIVTFRPEFDPLWIGRPYVMALTIRRPAERSGRACCHKRRICSSMPSHEAPLVKRQNV
jgi:predicted ATPase